MSNYWYIDGDDTVDYDSPDLALEIATALSATSREVFRVRDDNHDCVALVYERQVYLPPPGGIADEDRTMSYYGCYDQGYGDQCGWSPEEWGPSRPGPRDGYRSKARRNRVVRGVDTTAQMLRRRNDDRDVDHSNDIPF